MGNKNKSVVWGELTTYAPKYNTFHQPLFWVQAIQWFWFSAFFILFAILALGNRTWFNNWWALLTYMIGSAVVVVAGQVLAIIYYFHGHTRQASYENICTDTSGLTVTYSTYLAMAHTKEVVMAMIISIVSACASIAVWWSWLDIYKNASSFVGDRNRTSADITQPLEYSTYQTLLHLLLLFQLVPLLTLTRAVWAHVRPLVVTAHIISAANENTKKC